MLIDSDILTNVSRKTSTILTRFR